MGWAGGCTAAPTGAGHGPAAHRGMGSPVPQHQQPRGSRWDGGQRLLHQCSEAPAQRGSGTARHQHGGAPAAPDPALGPRRHRAVARQCHPAVGRCFPRQIPHLPRQIVPVVPSRCCQAQCDARRWYTRSWCSRGPGRPCPPSPPPWLGPAGATPSPQHSSSACPPASPRAQPVPGHGSPRAAIPGVCGSASTAAFSLLSPRRRAPVGGCAAGWAGSRACGSGPCSGTPSRPGTPTTSARGNGTSGWRAGRGR